MKKVQHLLCLLALLGIGTMSQAQIADNQTDDNWVIHYYGATTNVPNNTGPVTINIGTDCADGIYVNLASASCPISLPAPNTYPVSCAPDKDEVRFSDIPELTENICTTSPLPLGSDLYIDPTITFL